MEKEVMEIAEVICAHCGRSNWSVNLSHSSENKTFLILMCKSESCQNIVDESGEKIYPLLDFDVTGQGYDEENIEEEREVDCANLS